MRACEQCAEHFEPTTGAIHRFCCSTCRHRYHNQRKVTGPRTDRVPVEPVKLAVVAAIESHDFAARRSSIIETRDRLSYNRISIFLWGSRAGRPGLGDTTRLKRALGIMPFSLATRANSRYAQTINAELAARVVRYVNGDLHAAGL